MAKKLLITGALLLALFTAITLVKFNSDQNNSLDSASEKSLIEKEKIRQFWQIYRQATKHRLAGELDQAVLAYKQAIALNENHEDALYYYGNVCQELGKYRIAEEMWEKLARINPSSVRAHQQLGNIYLDYQQENIFDIQRAETAFQRAHDINGEETGPLLRLGEISLIKDDRNAASKYFDAVLGSNFKSVEAYFLNGYMAWKSKDIQRAQAMFAKAVDYSRPTIPTKGVLGEGDTKPGALSLEVKRTGPFHTLINNLTTIDQHSTPAQLDMRYREVDNLIAHIRKLAPAEREK
ncbi:MAG: tetratricopeptide repeat protein [bacterium]